MIRQFIANPDLSGMRTFVANRYKFLTDHFELRAMAPTISDVSIPAPPVAGVGASISARVTPDANLNVLLDSTAFGPLGTDLAWARPSANPTAFQIQAPTPGSANP